jgi:hypothetical protein
MSFKIKTGLGGLVSRSDKKRPSSPPSKPKIGKVYGIITTENTPTKELFESNNGWRGVGTIFYQEYDQYKDIDKVDLNTCKTALPFTSNVPYPLIGELVQIIEAPSPVSQLGNNAKQRYYTGVVNVWNNTQQNAPAGNTLGNTFIETSDIRDLYKFEGDIFYQGRRGNGIRFGSTNKFYANINEWSSGPGADGDPITMMINGYVTTPSTGSSSVPNIEEINKEQSSLYLTSTQLIPLIPDRVDIINPVTTPRPPSQYFSSQIILNSDRITLNSKKDEVMIFAKTNVEISTNNIINLNANLHTHINSPTIFLGTLPNGENPSEPVLLGDKTKQILFDITSALMDVANLLRQTVAPVSGGPIPHVVSAGTMLSTRLQIIQEKLNDITSDNVYTI